MQSPCPRTHASTCPLPSSAPPQARTRSAPLAPPATLAPAQDWGTQTAAGLRAELAEERKRLRELAGAEKEAKKRRRGGAGADDVSAAAAAAVSDAAAAVSGVAAAAAAAATAATAATAAAAHSDALLTCCKPRESPPWSFLQSLPYHSSQLGSNGQSTRVPYPATFVNPHWLPRSPSLLVYVCKVCEHVVRAIVAEQDDLPPARGGAAAGKRIKLSGAAAAAAAERFAAAQAAGGGGDGEEEAEELEDPPEPDLELPPELRMFTGGRGLRGAREERVCVCVCAGDRVLGNGGDVCSLRCMCACASWRKGLACATCIHDADDTKHRAPPLTPLSYC